MVICISSQTLSLPEAIQEFCCFFCWRIFSWVLNGADPFGFLVSILHGSLPQLCVSSVLTRSSSCFITSSMPTSFAHGLVYVLPASLQVFFGSRCIPSGWFHSLIRWNPASYVIQLYPIMITKMNIGSSYCHSYGTSLVHTVIMHIKWHCYFLIGRLLDHH